MEAGVGIEPAYTALQAVPENEPRRPKVINQEFRGQPPTDNLGRGPCSITLQCSSNRTSRWPVKAYSRCHCLPLTPVLAHNGAMGTNRACGSASVCLPQATFTVPGPSAMSRSSPYRLLSAILSHIPGQIKPCVQSRCLGHGLVGYPDSLHPRRGCT